MKNEVQASKQGKRGTLRSSEQRRKADQPLCTPMPKVKGRKRRKKLI